jgi:hypothetical protein
VAFKVSKVAALLPKFKVPKFTPVVADWPLTKQPVVNVNVALMVPVVAAKTAVGASAALRLVATRKSLSFIIIPY